MTTLADSEAGGLKVPLPAWIKASLEVKEGRDPLGLLTTTQDRLMPALLPGILELSRRARYFSFYAFLLAEYQARHLPADSNSLAAFIKRREWEFGLAVLKCPRNCGSSPVGARKLGAVASGGGPFPRGESVESPFGGYGLNYRTPMAEFGVVARTGTMLGDHPIPIDVLRGTHRARQLASAFKAAVEHTAYYQRAMWTADDLEAAVIVEYAEVACLCLLRELQEERDAVQDAMFGVDPPAAGGSTAEVAVMADPEGQLGSAPLSPAAAVMQRRRSVAHYLTMLEARPEVAESESAYREELWSPPAPRNDAHSLVAGQWAAVAAKDVWQDALCSVWSDFCRAGLAATRDLGRGLTWEETRMLAGAMTAGPPALDASSATAALAAGLAAGTLTVAADDGTVLNVASVSLEELRQFTERLDTASSGLIVLLELARRMAERSGPGWDEVADIGSGWQRPVAAVADGLRGHLAGSPTLGDTLWWLVSRFILPVHERIAYSKLPEFTFRFRWEEGLLRFYDNGVGRFPLAGIRHQSLLWLTWDLGLWDETSDQNGPAALTRHGMAFAAEALA